MRKFPDFFIAGCYILLGFVLLISVIYPDSSTGKTRDSIWLLPSAVFFITGIIRIILVILITRDEKNDKNLPPLLSLLFVMLIFSGCTKNIPQNKVNSHKIKFKKIEKLPVLYAQNKPQTTNYKNVQDASIAELKLQIQMLKRLNEYEKSFIPVAMRELRKFQDFTAKLKADIAKLKKYSKEIRALEKQLDSIRKRIVKMNKNGGNNEH